MAGAQHWVAQILAAGSPFGLHVRELVVGSLSLGVVGAAIYDLIANSRGNTVLDSWSGIIIGVYFGAHVVDSAHTRRTAREQK